VPRDRRRGLNRGDRPSGTWCRQHAGAARRAAGNDAVCAWRCRPRRRVGSIRQAAVHGLPRLRRGHRGCVVLRPISSRAHGVISYSVSGLLLAAPRLLRLREVPLAALAPRAAGATALSYSVLTDFELGVRRVLPLRAHLALDAVGGALLAVSPWLLRFAQEGRRFWLPHVLAGSGIVGVAALSRTEPDDARPRLVRRFRRPGRLF
jgi:hypothetical protein